MILFPVFFNCFNLSLLHSYSSNCSIQLSVEKSMHSTVCSLVCIWIIFYTIMFKKKKKNRNFYCFLSHGGFILYFSFEWKFNLNESRVFQSAFIVSVYYLMFFILFFFSVWTIFTCTHGYNTLTFITHTVWRLGFMHFDYSFIVVVAVVVMVGVGSGAGILCKNAWNN